MTLNKVYSIKELSNAVNNVLSTINIVTIEGEVVLPMIRDNRTNQVKEKKLDPREHWYFPLKDLNEPDDYQFDVTVFTYNRQADVIPKNGDVVRVTGYLSRPNVSVYAKSNKLSFRGYKVEIAGTGQFYASFKKTHRKLEPLGYFDPANKKPLPKYPMRIAVISGKQTAALRDVVFQIESRWPCAETLFFPAVMQGSTSPQSVINALRQAEASNSDVIILARGGGSVSDLWCFNDEALAHEIFRCKTPLIAGIGHKQDDTIAGLTADYNAATPTEAGIIATPLKSEIRKELVDSASLLKTAVTNRLTMEMQHNRIMGMELDKVQQRAANEMNLVKILLSQLKESVTRIPALGFKDIAYLKNELLLRGRNMYRNNDLKLNQLKSEMYPSVMQYYRHLKEALDREAEMIDSLGPLSVLRRGYSVSRQGEKVLKSINDVDMNTEIETRYADGFVISTPLKKERYNG